MTYNPDFKGTLTFSIYNIANTVLNTNLYFTILYNGRQKRKKIEK